MAKNFFVKLIGFLLTLVALLLIFVLSVKSTFLSPGYFEGVFEKSDAYNYTTKNVYPLVSDVFLKNPDLAKSGFSAIDFGKTIGVDLSSEWLKTNFQIIEAGVSDYILGRRDKVEATIDLSQFLNSSNKSIVGKINQTILSLKKCTPEEEQSAETLNCLPSSMIGIGSNGQESTGQIVPANLEQLLKNSDGKLDLGQTLTQDKNISHLRALVGFLTKGFYYLLGAAIFCLGLLVVLNLKDWRAILKSIAWPLLIAGILGLIFSAIMKVVFTSSLILTIANKFWAGSGAAFVGAINFYSRTILNPFLVKVIIYYALAAVFGIIILIIVRATAPKLSPTETQNSTG